MIYLASPYSHADPEIREARFEWVTSIAARFQFEGVLCYSPIVASHPLVADLSVMATNAGTPMDPVGFQFWKANNEWHITRCNALVVVMMEGWEDSKGIQAELVFAAKQHKPIEYLDLQSSAVEARRLSTLIQKYK